MNIEEKFMSIALKQAKKAFDNDEVPVGAVIVYNNKVIAKAYNKREKSNLTSGHAEMIAIAKANKKLKNWRLSDCDIYITVEPCLMCAGAIIQAQFKNVFYATRNPKGGAFGTAIDIRETKGINCHPNIYVGTLENEAKVLMEMYFSKKRDIK